MTLRDMDVEELDAILERVGEFAEQQLPEGVGIAIVAFDRPEGKKTGDTGRSRWLSNSDVLFVGALFKAISRDITDKVAGSN